MSRAELSNVFEHLMRVHDRLDPAVGLANMASGPWELGLMGILQPMFGERARAVMGRLLAGTGSVSSAEHGYAVLHLANIARTDPAALDWLKVKSARVDLTTLDKNSPFRIALERFLERYGHRAVYEADMLNPRWAEDPTYVLDQVRLVLADAAAFCGPRQCRADRARGRGRGP